MNNIAEKLDACADEIFELIIEQRRKKIPDPDYKRKVLTILENNFISENYHYSDDETDSDFPRLTISITAKYVYLIDKDSGDEIKSWRRKNPIEIEN